MTYAIERAIIGRRIVWYVRQYRFTSYNAAAAFLAIMSAKAKDK